MMGVGCESAVARVVARLQQVRKRGEGWQACCPAHADRQPSLSITARDGKVLLNCFAGCATEDILQAIGLRMGDLFAEEPPRVEKTIAAVYDYADAQGRLLFQTLRYTPKTFRQRQPDGLGGWHWHLRGITPVLFRLPRVLAAVACGETIYLVEGEKDVLALEALGLTATCNPMGAGKWRDSYTEVLRTARVVILPDADAPGQAHAARVAQALQGCAADVRLVNLPGLPEKGDVSDWLAQGHTREELLALVEESAAMPPPASLPMTDLGNAERLVAAHGHALRYHTQRGRWLTWTDQRWDDDLTGMVHRHAATVIRGLAAEADRLPTGPAREALLRHALRSESAPRLAAMVELARRCPEIPVLADRLDQQPFLFNCLNGTLDLCTGILRPHDPRDLLTRLAPVAFDPAAACPRWERFLEEIFQGDKALIAFAQRLAGYLLTGDTREQCVFFLVGKGANGKSVFVETLCALLGEYGKDTAFATFLDTRDTSTVDIAALIGARLVTASEADSGQRLKESLLKRLAGGDAVTCRYHYQEPFTYRPTYKLLFATNEVPRFDSQGYAMRRRVHILPFRQTFYAPEDGKTPLRDDTLPRQLRAEWPGILAWAVRGCRAWQQHGLHVPPVVQAATAALFDTFDPLGDFLADACVLHPAARVDVGTLWKHYLAWCDAQERPPAFRAPQTFSRNITQRDGIDAARRRQGRYLIGIGLRCDDDDD